MSDAHGVTSHIRKMVKHYGCKAAHRRSRGSRSGDGQPTIAPAHKVGLAKLPDVVSWLRDVLGVGDKDCAQQDQEEYGDGDGDGEQQDEEEGNGNGCKEPPSRPVGQQILLFAHHK